MNNRNKKRLKRIVGCVSAIAMLIGSIPVGTLVASAEGETEQEYVNVLENDNITLHGVTYGETEQAFIRLDSETAAEIAGTSSLDGKDDDKSEEWLNTVYSLAREAAGGRIRFRTDSTYVAIKATLTIHDAAHLSHGSKMEAAKYGFDVYVDSAEGSVYAGTVRGEAPTKSGTGVSNTEVLVEGTVNLGEAADRDLTIYFPITSETKSVEIGVAEGSTIKPHETDYEEGKHLVFYGSSITQGGAVTKPGNTYVNTVGRNMNMEYTNFGMWGRCKGEPAFANYIAGLGNISAFVYDFDHNISKVNQMEPVHYPFYETVRRAYPNIPIIMITRPGNNLDNTAATDPSYSTTAEMKEVIYKSYQKAVAAEDENVHFIDGEAFFGYDEQYFTPTDYTHPNDVGQARMAAVVQNVLERALDGEKNICIAPSCESSEPTYSYDFEDDAKAEDNEDNSGATGWTVNLHEEKYTEPKFDVVKEDENNAFQLQYTRASNSIYNGVISDESLLNSVSDFTIEMKTTAYKDTVNNRWGYVALALVGSVDGADKMDRFDIRLEPNGTGCKVHFYDRSNRTNVQKYAVGYDSTFVFEDLSNYYNDTATTFTYNLKVEVETVDIPSGDREDFICRVYLGYQEAEEQEPIWEEPVVLKTELEKNGFNPEKIGLFAITGKDDAVCKVTVDDINVYKPGKCTITHVEEVPTTTEEAGKDAHHVCSSCGQLYLDANGVLKTTDEELTNAKLVPCDTIFKDNFSTLTNANKEKNWSLYNSNVDNKTGALVIEHDGSDNQAYITASKSGLLKGATDFGFKMDATIYKDIDNDCWTYMGVMFRQATPTVRYEIRIKPLEDGYTVQLYVDGKYVKSKAVDDEKFASLFAGGTEISYQLRAIVDTDGQQVKFYVYVDNNDVVVLEATPTTIGKPSGTRVMLYSTGEGVLGHKVAVDNMEAYYTTHKTSYVAEVPATDTTMGTKAHYVCSKCEKIFLDEACTIVATNADLKTAKLVPCDTLYTNDCNQTTHYQEKNGATVDNKGETLVISGGTKEEPYIIIGDPNVESAKIMTDAKSNFSFKMDSISYKDSNGNWTYAQVGFRRTGVGIYGVRIIPTSTGYTAQLCWDVDESILGSIDVVDERFASLYAEGTEISYKLCVVSEFDSTSKIGDFHIYVDNNYVETFSVERSDAWKPDTARIYLHSTGTDVIGHQVSIDNIEIYKTTHDAVTAVEATLKTEDDPGMKAHYLCGDCEKKFLDESATIEATDADLAYAQLTDVLYQTRKNKTNPNNTDIRFVAYVDDYTKYSGVTFTITCGGKNGSATTKTVYQKIYADHVLYATSDIYGTTEGRFATFILSNNSRELLDQGMTVTATYIPADGTEPTIVYSRTIEF